MLRNWRSSLLFNKLAFRQDDNLLALVVDKDVYKPVEYIALDGGALHGESTLQWAKAHFGDFGFDFDTYSMLLWPMDDGIPVQEVVSRINSAFPSLASTKRVSPALAHGLDETSPLGFEDFPSDDSQDKSNINLSF